jgi:hypothetical protein
MQDIKIAYSGGSGGFLLLHLLLLSGEFYSAFDTHDSLTDVINRQWGVTNHRDWKKSEVWPNNRMTLSSDTQRRRLYFFCNPYISPVDQANFLKYSAKSFVLYTDIYSQCQLAFYKKANWFFDTNSDCLKTTVYKDLVRRWNQHYNKIKDPTWPSHVSPRRIDQLPMPISQEILESPFTNQHLSRLSDFLLQKILPFPSGIYNKNPVVQELLPYLHGADLVINLQDLINSNGSALTDILDIPPINQQQLNLIDQWKKLHPPALLEKIGIRH